MKKVFVTAAEMFEIDRLAAQEYGIPAVVLMENAGRAVFEEVIRMGKNARRRRDKIVCVCGKGNNGGDGFVCARHLLNHGFDVEVFLIDEPEALKGEARLNVEILKRMGFVLRVLKNVDDVGGFKKSIKNAALVIDALFGIGLNGPVKGFQRSIITAVNRSGKTVLSVDVPSGLDASLGKILGVCVRAQRTVTFALPKTGFLTAQGKRYAGKIVIADISIPRALLGRYAQKKMFV
ncbi:MAG: NAD(P)H-hydrate epimerase [Candidatus Omnitrophota bacterium]